MKSRFFGLNAKLALAVLAVGTMFTSCYDSENGDVVRPYTPEPPKYIVTGYVTNYETGEPLTATVTVGTQSVTTTGGSYSMELNETGTLSVTIEATDFTTVTRSLEVTPITTGVAMYTVDAALWNEAAIPGIKVETLNQENNDDTWDVTSVSAIDFINDTDDPMPLTFTVANMNQGAKFLSTGNYESTANETKAIGDTAEEVFVNYCVSYLGVNPRLGITADASVDFSYTLAPNCAINSATARTYRVDERYTFTYNGTEYSYTIRRISGYAFIPTVVAASLSHGHGHGHGHGGDLNAGGGIWE